MNITRAERNNKKEPVRESMTLELSVISPVHIGCREGRITALEYVVGQGRVHLIDEDKFGRFLGDKDLIDSFVQAAGRGPVRMERFLRETEHLSIPDQLDSIVSRSIPGGDPRMQDFRPFIRDGNGRIYLPGSSLKGVFRTAVLYRMLKKDPDLCQYITSKTEKNIGHIRQKKKFYSAQWLQQNHLQSFSLPSGKPGPNEDLMRCLTIRDAYPLGEVENQVIRINFLSFASNGQYYWSQRKDKSGRSIGRDLFVWLEVITAGTFSLEICWDNRLFSHFQKNNPSQPLPVSGLEDLFAALFEMNLDLIEHEKGFFSKNGRKTPSGKNTDEASRVATSLHSWYVQKNKNLFRLGFGSGMLSTTVNLAIPHELRQKIRDICGSGRRPGELAPKSRRIWRKAKDEYLPMGWMQIQKEDEKKSQERLELDFSSLKKKFKVKQS